MNHDVVALADELEGRLAALGTPERAVKERQYLKSDLRHLGVTVPAMRRTTVAFAREERITSHDDVVGLAAALWDRPIGAPVFERRMAAVEILEHAVEALGPADVPLLERFLRQGQTWALVDNLAASVVARLEQAHPEALDGVVRRWAADDDLWLRRSALLVHLLPLRAGGGNWQRFTEIADAMLEEKEFFIRKAIGWVLRDTSRRRPDLVVAWIEPRASRAAGLTVREAVKRLPPEDRERILARRNVTGSA